VARLARQRGHTLTGVDLIVGSEPLTEAKQQEMESSGARVFPRYHSTEMGTVGTGCLFPAEAGDYHLAMDTLTVVQPELAAPGEPGAFLFTTFGGAAPKVLLNADVGDHGTVAERDCGCLFDRLGFRTHITRVRSGARVTCEGMAVPVADLVAAAEQALSVKRGLSALDYQWVLREERGGLTRLALRVRQSQAGLDSAEVAADVYTALARTRAGSLAARVWQQGGTVRVVREPIPITTRGKTLPFVHEV
jgi:phenylacetate-coenzyme A ligase PaaK-like adenylate-forming protein